MCWNSRRRKSAIQFCSVADIAFIFDLDETLVDSPPALRAALKGTQDQLALTLETPALLLGV